MRNGCKDLAQVFAVFVVLGRILGVSQVAAITFSDPGFFSETVATLPPFQPVGLTFAPDGRIFVWQRNGVINIVKNGTLLQTPFLDFSDRVNTYTDRGFLGVALDPNFIANGHMYLLYTYESGGNPNDPGPKTARMSRVTADPSNSDVVLANSEVVILGTMDTPPCSDYPAGTDCIPADSYTHTIGTLRFAPDGTLFVGNGDGASPEFADILSFRSQDLDSYAGKILRIRPDGFPPAAPLVTNPFDDGTNSIRSKVWAYGLRNPFRFALHPIREVPYIGDVGWKSIEEINEGIAGANYGWPCYEGTLAQQLYQSKFPQLCQALPSNLVTPPIFEYVHGSGPNAGSTVIGGTFFTGNQYPAQYAGNLFFAEYTNGWIKRMTFNAAGNVQSMAPFASDIGNQFGGPVSVELGPDGLLYYIVFTTGEIARIRHISGTGSNFPPQAVATATPSSGYSPLNVSFSSDGSSDPEGKFLIFLWDFGDGTTSNAPNPSHTYIAARVTSFDATLTVTDVSGASSTANTTVTVGSLPPLGTIQSPEAGAHLTVGQTVQYQGAATDADDGLLPNSALTWTILLHHNTHIHPFIETIGKGGSFLIEDHDPAGVFAYEFILTAEDSSGLQDTHSIIVPVDPPLKRP